MYLWERGQQLLACCGHRGSQHNQWRDPAAGTSGAYCHACKRYCGPAPSMARSLHRPSSSASRIATSAEIRSLVSELRAASVMGR